MAYEIQFAKVVTEEQIPAIPMPCKEQIKKAIRERLADAPTKVGKPLRHSLYGYRRLRVGDWRVIFNIEKQIVRIVKIGHRRDVYEG